MIIFIRSLDYHSQEKWALTPAFLIYPSKDFVASPSWTEYNKTLFVLWTCGTEIPGPIWLRNAQSCLEKVTVGNNCASKSKHTGNRLKSEVEARGGVLHLHISGLRVAYGRTKVRPGRSGMNATVISWYSGEWVLRMWSDIINFE